MKPKEKVYLGDGLYAIDHGFQIALSTLEGNEVFLEDGVLHSFISFVSKSRGVKITMEKVTDAPEKI